MLPLETNCQTVRELLNSDQEFLLLDCREPFEYEIVQLRSATLLPISQLAARSSELEPFRTQHVVIYCHHGMRSLQLARWLRQQGFDRAQSMAGGIDQWAIEIEPGLPRY